MSIALAGPIKRGNIQEMPYSAISPRFANAVPNRAESDANRKSQVQRNDETQSNPQARSPRQLQAFEWMEKYEYFFWKSARTPGRPPFPEFLRTCSRP